MFVQNIIIYEKQQESLIRKYFQNYVLFYYQSIYKVTMFLKYEIQKGKSQIAIAAKVVSESKTV